MENPKEVLEEMALVIHLSDENIDNVCYTQAVFDAVEEFYEEIYDIKYDEFGKISLHDENHEEIFSFQTYDNPEVGTIIGETDEYGE